MLEDVSKRARLLQILDELEADGFNGSRNWLLERIAEFRAILGLPQTEDPKGANR